MVDLPTPKDIAPQHKMFRAAASSHFRPETVRAICSKIFSRDLRDESAFSQYG
jgi:hypothetical protein